MSALLQATRRVLDRELRGEGHTSEDVAAAAAAACERLYRRLDPVIGDAGTQALFVRTLNLTRRAFPDLSTGGAAPPDTPWNHLRACLARLPADVARQVSATLLANFVELLGRIIGQGLTASFLHDLWPDEFPGRPKEPT